MKQRKYTILPLLTSLQGRGITSDTSNFLPWGKSIRRGIVGFTLVELIVVVTILAILATIGFVSYSSYLTGVRDTNRLSQLVSISDGLELYKTRNSLPIPDDNVEVQANGTTIAYQGYAGSNTLETIDFTKGGKDPKDDSYFSYYLTQDRKYFQLLGFLEEENITSYNKYLSPLTHITYAVDYENRIPTVYGKKLGVLTDTTNVPIQEILTSAIDIATETSDYVAHFTDSFSITGSGGTLLSALVVNNPNFSQYDSSLVTYFTFDGGSLEDASVTGGSATLVGSAKLETIKGEEALLSPRASTDYVNIGSPAILSSGLSDFSVSVWTKLEADLFDGSASSNYHILGNETYESMGFEARIEHHITPSSSGRISFRTNTSGSASTTSSVYNEYPNDQKWHHLVFVKNGTSGKIYLNGQEISGYLATQSMQDYASSTNDFVFGSFSAGAGQSFSGYLDDIRIYNRPISSAEVGNLYMKEKKID